MDLDVRAGVFESSVNVREQPRVVGATAGAPGGRAEENNVLDQIVTSRLRWYPSPPSRKLLSGLGSDPRLSGAFFVRDIRVR